MLLGYERVSLRLYFFACCMVALGTMFSSFWFLANNSWMQVPLGHSRLLPVCQGQRADKRKPIKPRSFLCIVSTYLGSDPCLDAAMGQSFDINQVTNKPTRQPKITSATLWRPCSTPLSFEWCVSPAAMTMAAVIGA